MTQNSAKHRFHYISESIRLPLTENHLPSGILQTTAKKIFRLKFWVGAKKKGGI